jgi:DnaJ-class molecular chaperone
VKSLHEQNHYEVLEVTRGAGAEEIERAYRVAHSTYSESSLALYSVFDEGDSEAISQRVEFAYQVLSDQSARAKYDEELGLDPEEPDFGSSGSSFDPEPEESLPPVSSTLDDLEDEVEEEGESLDGPRLRRARMRRGISLEDIAEITKVSARYLRYLEEEDFKELPAEVYVRGFLTAYVRAIGLDPNRAVPDFMARYKEARTSKRKSRLRGKK